MGGHWAAVGLARLGALRAAGAPFEAAREGVARLSLHHAKQAGHRDRLAEALDAANRGRAFRRLIVDPKPGRPASAPQPWPTSQAVALP